MNLVLAFLAGMFIANSLPHFITGVQGKTHMTPLSKNSSALVNVVWGFINLVFGIWIFNVSGGNLAMIFAFDDYSMSFFAGVFVLAITAALLFSNPKARFPWFKK